jgi:hypothetical protein
MPNPSIDFAPVAVFVYNRPGHTRRALESLFMNPEIHESLVTVYCDGPRTVEDEEKVEATRRVVREVVPSQTRIVERETNLGLANSIIRGVTKQCEDHGQVIVIEDDLVLSRSAIGFLNNALNWYRSEEAVMHVSAYMFPVQGSLPDAFFYREATCWGWGTWERAWRHFEPSPEVIQEYIESNSLVSEFNIRGSMKFWEMLEHQREGRIDSWAIRWYGSMFMRGGLALHPGRSLVRNEGFDGSGQHCGVSSDYDVELSGLLPTLPEIIVESEAAVRAMIDYRSTGSRSSTAQWWLPRLSRRAWNFLRHKSGNR